MYLWIATIGSSDVQLISNEANQAKGRTEKQRSNKVWSYWYTDALKADCYDISFEPKQAFNSKDEAYRIPPRILGRVYQASDESGQKEIWDYLTFPLLDNFVQLLKNYPTPEAIAVLLTDQSTIFKSERQRKPNSPYWQDTCELQPILQSYFTANFPDSLYEFLCLTPNSEDESLENWNAVLDLVREKLHNLTIAGQPIQVNLEENVYVSHQAGTPAISSAVQFASLATFGDRVRFLVSNEQNASLTHIVESSAYLRGIKQEQARELLKSHDYAGVNDLIAKYINIDAKILLNAALQWNYAKFDNFADELEKLSDKKFQNLVQKVKERREHWWWEAYEAAYLGVVRLEQDNTVEAMFHSFRAIEGLLKKWLCEKSGLAVKDGKAQLLEEVEYINKKGEKKKTRSANAYGQGLYFALSSVKNINKTRFIDIWTFGNSVFDRRNKLFHQLGGLQDKDAVFAEWKSPDESSLDEKGWNNRVVNCLNFISNQDFVSIEKASLMAKVHQILFDEIISL